MYTVNFILDKVSNSKWGSQSSKHYKLLNGASTIKNTPNWAIWIISFLIGSNPNYFFNTSNKQFWKERLIWNIKKLIFDFDTKSRIPPIVARLFLCNVGGYKCIIPDNTKHFSESSEKSNYDITIMKGTYIIKCYVNASSNYILT